MDTPDRTRPIPPVLRAAAAVLATSGPPPVGWQAEAGCTGRLDFLAADTADDDQAATCADCPVAVVCLADALATDDRDDTGVRAGTGPADRHTWRGRLRTTGLLAAGDLARTRATLEQACDALAAPTAAGDPPVVDAAARAGRALPVAVPGGLAPGRWTRLAARLAASELPDDLPDVVDGPDGPVQLLHRTRADGRVDLFARPDPTTEAA